MIDVRENKDDFIKYNVTPHNFLQQRYQESKKEIFSLFVSYPEEFLEYLISPFPGKKEEKNNGEKCYNFVKLRVYTYN